MASITSLTGSSSTSSVYGNSNVISGLATGMDTESMIENAVSGIKNKIKSLNQDRTMLEWEQNSYRSIIDKLSSFSDKYLSYTSNTNLLSAAFFNSAMKVTASGTYANLVSATGKTSSDFRIMAATQATTATHYGIGTFELAEGETFKTSMTMQDLKLMGEGETQQITINGKSVDINATDTVDQVISKINSSDLGVSVSYSSFAGNFVVKSKETGKDGSFTMESDLAQKLFGSGAEQIKGTDASITVEINGETITKTQSNNDFKIDGMTVSVKGDFAVTGSETGVSFTSTADSDKIVDAIKSMIADYNAMANEIKGAYSTKPQTDSKGKRYKPLTEEDAADMSEAAIEKYEKKAKAGILFGDDDLFRLYDEMRTAISDMDLSAIGVTTKYESGKTTLELDETKLRSVLESDPDKVKNAFTKSKDGGAATDGAMTKLQSTINKYAKTTGDKGILVKLAGSEKAVASLSDNTYKSKMDRVQEQIKRWEEKLSNKIDYYTKQFTALEKLVSEMNSQSSALMGMMGY